MSIATGWYPRGMSGPGGSSQRNVLISCVSNGTYSADTAVHLWTAKRTYLRGAAREDLQSHLCSTQGIVTCVRHSGRQRVSKPTQQFYGKATHQTMQLVENIETHGEVIWIGRNAQRWGTKLGCFTSCNTCNRNP